MQKRQAKTKLQSVTMTAKSTRNLAQMGIRRIPGNTLAAQINRSHTYVYKRLNEESEWKIGDIAAICRVWNMSITTLLHV